jgi:hypothetical protein
MHSWDSENDVRSQICKNVLPRLRHKKLVDQEKKVINTKSVYEVIFIKFWIVN